MSEKLSTLLIVEDDHGHLRLIEKNLKRSGIGSALLSFTDGQSVMDYLEGKDSARLPENPSRLFMLLDLRLPKLDGLEVLKRIKNDPELRKIPVSILSTSDDPREIEKCYLLGCSYYFVKPSEYEKFSEVISELARLSQLASLSPVKTSPKGIH